MPNRKVIVEGREYRLTMTCSFCPEQYDVVDDVGRQVGNLRIKHGRFTAQYPDVGGKLVFYCETEGNGEFVDHERSPLLQLAIIKIDREIQETSDA